MKTNVHVFHLLMLPLFHHLGTAAASGLRRALDNHQHPNNQKIDKDNEKEKQRNLNVRVFDDRRRGVL